MIPILLTIEAVIFILALVAFGLAVVGRISLRWVRWTLIAVLAWLPALIAALAFLDSYQRNPRGWGHYWYLTPTPARFVVVCVVVFYVALLCLPWFAFRRVPAVEPRIPRARQWRLRKLLLAGLGSLVAFVATLWLYDWTICRELERAVAANEQIVAKYLAERAPADQDAGPGLLKLLDTLGGHEGCPEWLRERDAVFDPKSPEIVEFFRAHEDQVRQAIALAKLPAANFRCDDADVLPHPNFDDLAGLSVAGQLLERAASERAGRGDLAGAYECLQAMRDLNRIAVYPRTLVAGIVTLRERARMELLGQLLNENPKVAFEFQFPLAINRPIEFAKLWPNLECEAAVEPRTNYKLHLGGLTDSTLYDDEMREQYQHHRWAWRLSFATIRVTKLADDVPAWPAFVERLKGIVTKEPADVNGFRQWSIDWPQGAGSVFVANQGYSMVHIIQLAINEKSRAIVGDLSVATVAYKLRHGAYPKSFAALVPEFIDAAPTNPATEEPYSYATDEPDVFWEGYDPDKYSGAIIKADEETMVRLGDAYTGWKKFCAADSGANTKEAPDAFSPLDRPMPPPPPFENP
ncbi:MAG: hypothetical protein JSS27_11910 [Planctomycetes bacterium]|nr:hypothetical protein [Planctomycetota bacterium]